MSTSDIRPSTIGTVDTGVKTPVHAIVGMEDLIREVRNVLPVLGEGGVPVIEVEGMGKLVQAVRDLTEQVKDLTDLIDQRTDD